MALIQVLIQHQEQQHNRFLLQRWTGLPEDQIKRLQRTRLEAQVRDSDSNPVQCPVCLADLEAGETVIHLPCKPHHVFHAGRLLL